MKDLTPIPIKQKRKVFLTIKCRNMKNPKLQRSRLDQTLGSTSWMLQENLKPVINKDGTVTTTSIWGRVFGRRKTEMEINKLVDNLLKRATAYAEIDDYSATTEFETITSDADDFKLAPVLFSDD
ncbi:hypothetical protein KJ966_21580 [bacterium]|nr:hypothetical protein [bacterium]